MNKTREGLRRKRKKKRKGGAGGDQFCGSGYSQHGTARQAWHGIAWHGIPFFIFLKPFFFLLLLCVSGSGIQHTHTVTDGTERTESEIWKWFGLVGGALAGVAF